MGKVYSEDTALVVAKAFNAEYVRWYFRGYKERGIFEAVLDVDGDEESTRLSGNRDEAQEQFERIRNLACGRAAMVAYKNSPPEWFLKHVVPHRSKADAGVS